jgi:ATP-dependent protease ClpP protease subunit
MSWIRVLSGIANSNDRDVTLFMNSNGGNVVAGIHCYDRHL